MTGSTEHKHATINFSEFSGHKKYMVFVTPLVLGLLLGHLHCMSLSLICSYTSIEPMRHVYMECACNTSLKHMQHTFVNCVSSVYVRCSCLVMQVSVDVTSFMCFTSLLSIVTPRKVS
jgi:hypothetical protein